MLVYHGTAHCLVSQIQDVGLVPRPSAGVYVTTSMPLARDYAVRATAYELLRRQSGDQRGAVVMLDMPDDLLIPDEEDYTDRQFYLASDVLPEAVADVVVFDAAATIEEFGADVLALSVEVARQLEDWKAGLVDLDPTAVTAPLRRLMSERI